ncbi:MAG: hypothetical protein Q8M95_03790 [Candidatus Methanoperedens sp.]|nr:hypothetical protein [Candidatus Methanoperedens sp.]
MLFSRDPQKELQSLFKKIESGRASDANIVSLVQLLDKQPSLKPEAIRMLISLTHKGDMKVCSSIISSLNRLAENDLRLAADSIDAITSCMQRAKEGFHEELLLNALEILSGIYQEYPECMGIAVPELLGCMENISPKVRNRAYLVLDALTFTRSEFFLGRSKELIRVLNSLNVDARILACSLIRNVSAINPMFVKDTYNVLEELRLNHPDPRLRSEASSAMGMLKPDEKPAEKVSIESTEVKYEDATGTSEFIDVNKSVEKIGAVIEDEQPEVNENLLYEGVNLIAPNEKDLKAVLESMGLEHLIRKN